MLGTYRQVGSITPLSGGEKHVTARNAFIAPKTFVTNNFEPLCIM